MPITPVTGCVVPVDDTYAFAVGLHVYVVVPELFVTVSAVMTPMVVGALTMLPLPRLTDAVYVLYV
jgi:hypothetical protein